MSRRAVPLGNLALRTDVSSSAWVALPNSADYQYTAISCSGGVYAFAADTTPTNAQAIGFFCVQQQVTYLENSHKTVFVRARSGSNQVVTAGFYNDLDLEG